MVVINLHRNEYECDKQKGTQTPNECMHAVTASINLD